jgi:hypothetical protein
VSLITTTEHAEEEFEKEIRFMRTGFALPLGFDDEI